MKLTETIFCFLCLLLLISSLHHLRLYIRCNNKNSELITSLNNNIMSNQKLGVKIQHLNSRVNNLREVSAKKIVENRGHSKNTNQMGRSASQLINSLQDKLLHHQQLQGEINEEVNVQELRKQQMIEQERRKILRPPLPPISEQPYLLIEPQH